MAKQESVNENTLIADLKQQRFKPVYLLTGEEDYYIDLVSDFFENHVIAPEYQDFDQTVVYGRDVDMSMVLGCAKRYPMLAPYQLVLVKESQDIDVKSWDLLVPYLEHPCERTILVFCYRHKKFDKRTKAYLAIKREGVVYEHAKLYEDQLPTWIANYVNAAGYSITQKAALLISESLGNDLGKIANELSKVFIVLEKGSVIDDNVVESNIGISKDYNVFELQNAIGRRDVVKCNRIVNHFAANPKDNPIQMVLPLLYSYIVKVMIYIQEPDKLKAASVMKVHPFFLKDYEVAASNYSLGKLASCIGYIHEADLRGKGIRNSGTITEGEILKELIFKIIH